MSPYIVTTISTFRCLATSPRAAEIASTSGAGSYEGRMGKAVQCVRLSESTETKLESKPVPQESPAKASAEEVADRIAKWAFGPKGNDPQAAFVWADPVGYP